MRYFIASALCLLMAFSQAHGCQGGMENSLFFDAIPNPQPDADVIARIAWWSVSGLRSDIGTAKAEVLEVLKSSDARIFKGSVVPMLYPSTRCDFFQRNGNKGIIIAKAGARVCSHLSK